MPLYSYVLRDAQGTVQSGMVRAKSQTEATSFLEATGGAVQELKQEEEAGLSPAWTTNDLDTNPLPELVQSRQYAPLTDTFRLYAGWLLAWYVVLYVAGAYQRLGKLPVRLPYVQDLIGSGMVASAAFAAFLVLLLTSLQRILKGGLLLGWLLAIGGGLAFLAFSQNV